MHFQELEMTQCDRKDTFINDVADDGAMQMRP